MLQQVALACLCVSVHSAIDADEIKSLPGWDGPLPSRQWSGYLDVPGDRGLKHYRKRVNIRTNVQ